MFSVIVYNIKFQKVFRIQYAYSMKTWMCVAKSAYVCIGRDIRWDIKDMFQTVKHFLRFFRDENVFPKEATVFTKVKMVKCVFYFKPHNKQYNLWHRNVWIQLVAKYLKQFFFYRGYMYFGLVYWRTFFEYLESQKWHILNLVYSFHLFGIYMHFICQKRFSYRIGWQ